MNISQCNLCPRNCGVDRTNRTNKTNGKIGFCGAGYHAEPCRTGNKIEISWFGIHHGEEPVISGTNGSGTIFFCRCNLKCVFCQNWQISQQCGENEALLAEDGESRRGCRGYEVDEIVEIMLELQEKGAHNINLVSPTVWSYWLKKIILKAKKNGLKIPIVWNSNGYEDPGVLREMRGLVDIYLPDYKYDIAKLAIKYSSAPDYPQIAQKAIIEMQRQVGDLLLNKNGIAKKGLIIRHLILPNAMENTKGCLRFISSISKKIHLSLMSQYNPLYQAKEFGEINRPITKEEFEAAKKLVSGFSIKNGWVQEFGGSVKCLSPDFRKELPFDQRNI